MNYGLLLPFHDQGAGEFVLRSFPTPFDLRAPSSLEFVVILQCQIGFEIVAIFHDQERKLFAAEFHIVQRQILIARSLQACCGRFNLRHGHLPGQLVAGLLKLQLAVKLLMDSVVVQLTVVVPVEKLDPGGGAQTVVTG